MSLLKISSYVGAVVTICAAGYFMFVHFASSQETAERSKSTAEIVGELQAIRIQQATAEEAEKKTITELCLSHKLKDPVICAKVGVEVDE